mmetsp:Transcript_9156/g.17272  ORF Transcript_9156/g.17272 Transcript_9156/m.17272 type:complete len:260 (-) Transcript_9156:1460-2239(-)
MCSNVRTNSTCFSSTEIEPRQTVRFTQSTFVSLYLLAPNTVVSYWFGKNGILFLSNTPQVRNRRDVFFRFSAPLLIVSVSCPALHERTARRYSGEIVSATWRILGGMSPTALCRSSPEANTSSVPSLENASWFVRKRVLKSMLNGAGFVKVISTTSWHVLNTASLFTGSTRLWNSKKGPIVLAAKHDHTNCKVVNASPSDVADPNPPTMSRVYHDARASSYLSNLLPSRPNHCCSSSEYSGNECMCSGSKRSIFLVKRW